MNLSDFRKRLNSQMLKHSHARETLRAERQGLREAREEAVRTNEAQQIVQEVAQTIEQQAHDRIARIVTRCFQALFEDPYEFRIVFERKRGKTEARLVFMRQGKEVDPKTAAGGGVVDVAAFALRLSGLILSRPTLRRVVVLDEPFKFLSAEFRPRVRELLDLLADELGMQFIIVTHIDELQTGTVIKIN